MSLAPCSRYVLFRPLVVAQWVEQAPIHKALVLEFVAPKRLDRVPADLRGHDLSVNDPPGTAWSKSAAEFKNIRFRFGLVYSLAAPPHVIDLVGGCADIRRR